MSSKSTGLVTPGGALSPMFKWTGGKRREIKHFKDMYPDYILNQDMEATYVEPFVGGGAVFFDLNHPGDNVINDFETDVTNFYKQAGKRDKTFLKTVAKMETLYKSGTHDQQEAEYYRLRNMDREPGVDKISEGLRAGRFYVTNQLAFSGMRRFNGNGEFNVPYGHYKSFNPVILKSAEHLALLQRTNILNGDYKDVLKKFDNPKTFIFIDPPYTRVMKKYGNTDEFGDKEQHELAAALNNLQNAHYMVVIDKSPLTEAIYANSIKKTYSLKYGVNIKNRFKTDVQHIVATNY